MKSIGALLKESISYVADNALMLLKVAGWSVLVYFGYTFGTALIIGAIVAVGAALDLLVWNVGTGSLTMILLIAWLVFIFALAGKMYYFMLAAIREPITDIKGAWKKISLKDGLSFYWLILLLMSAVYGSFILLIIPGIIVGNWIAFSLFIRVEQGERGIRAMMLSRDYVKGYWWQTFGRLIAACIVMIPVSYILMLIFQKSLELGGLMVLLGFVIYYLGVLAIMAVFYRFNYATYQDLVRIKGKLAFKTTGWRTFRWSLLAYGPLILGLVGIIISAVLTAVNPAEQIEKARNQAVQQELLKMEQALPSAE